MPTVHAPGNTPGRPVILAAKRTPIGKFLGGLSRVPSPNLDLQEFKGSAASAP